MKSDLDQTLDQQFTSIREVIESEPFARMTIADADEFERWTPGCRFNDMHEAFSMWVFLFRPELVTAKLSRN